MITPWFIDPNRQLTLKESATPESLRLYPPAGNVGGMEPPPSSMDGFMRFPAGGCSGRDGQAHPEGV